MFDDFSSYYGENVIDAYVAYRQTSEDGVAGRSRDLREAIVAATALFHLREHLPTGITISRADVEKLCPDYGLLGDLVHAAKHSTVNRPTPHGPPLVTRARDLREQILLIEYEDNAGAYRFIQKQVVVALTDGSERALIDLLTNVLNFWESWLAPTGLLPAARVFRHNGEVRYRSRDECTKAQLGFEMVQGRRFMQSMRLLRWNPATSCAEPVDLTGANLRFRIYRPKFEFEVTLAHAASGKEYMTSIELTDEEGQVIANLATEDEKNAYALGLPAAQQALRTLAREAGLPVADGPSHR